MTSYTFKGYLESFIDATDTSQFLVKYIFILSKGYGQLASDMTDMLKDTSNRSLVSKKQWDTQERFLEFKRHAEGFPLGQIFHELLELRSSLNHITDEFRAIGDEFIETLPDHLDEFYAALEAFVKSGEAELFVDLMLEAHHLYPILRTARQAFVTTHTVLFGQHESRLQGHEQELELLFDHEQTYDSAERKLRALKKAYAEVCNLVDVDVKEHPLNMVRMELGASLWIIVRGHSTVMRIVTALITRFTLFLYHRYSAGGQSSGMPERVIATQSLVNLADELDQAGFSESLEDDQQLKQSALFMRREITSILAGEPSLRINDTLYEVDKPAQKRYIEESYTLVPKRTEPVSLQV